MNEVPTIIPKFAVAHLGSRMNYAVPRSLWEKGWLEILYTDTVCPPLFKWLNNFHFSSLKRLPSRCVPIPSDKVISFPSVNMMEIILRKFCGVGGKKLNLKVNDFFARKILRHGLHDANAIYAFKTAALPLFKANKANTIFKILEQTSMPAEFEGKVRRQLLSEWPCWEADVKDDWQNYYVERENEEWELADFILTPSDRVAEELIKNGVQMDKIAVVPYGVDVGIGGTKTKNKNIPPLRVLMAGRISLLKGIPYLIEAAKILPQKEYEFVLAGMLVCEKDKFLSSLPSNVKWVGHLSKSKLKEMYKWADVFCLPTFSEGSATVVYEALAFGLPVITTPQAGSVVRDGIEGIIVDAGDAKALADALKKLAENPSLYSKFSEMALKRALTFASFNAYSERLINSINRAFCVFVDRKNK